MNAPMYLEKEEDLIEYLEKQILECDPVNTKFVEKGKDYLLHRKIFSVLEINDAIISDYISYLNQINIKSELLIKRYQNTLIKWKDYHKRKEFRELIKEVERCDDIRSPLRNKVITYLVDSNIHKLNEINCETRIAYENYLRINKYKEVDSYVKALDKLKLYDLKKSEDRPYLLKSKPQFQEKKYFLGYYPNYEIANSFYNISKESLIWDFTIKADRTLKHQIFSMLIYAVEEIDSIETKMKFYVKPLMHLYKYCIETKVTDLTMLEQEDINNYEKSVPGNGQTVKRYKQIINKIQKFLFVKADSVNWNANVWYLERFHFSETRINPSLPFYQISFLDMKNGRNRDLLKEFIKYQLGVSKYSIRNILGGSYQIKHFLRFIDEKEILVEAMKADVINQYLRMIDIEGGRAATYNDKLSVIYNFFSYLKIHNYIKKIPFILEYYIKAEIPKHLDRTVPEDTIDKIFQHLDQFPEDIRLIFLHLWCLGLRLNEVCTIKVNNYYTKDEVKWLRIYQHKMKSEKVIPIPKMLYEATQVYIKRYNRDLSGYIFQNRTGGAFNVGTFWHTMNDLCKKYNIHCRDYIFKSHDYRHSIATKLYDQGVSLQVIRDFLGHKYEDMTKQYIDYIPKKIEEKSVEYYKGNTSLVNEWKRGK